MKRLIIALLLILLPAGLYAIPSIGMYFSYDPTNPGQGHYEPNPGELFSGFIYVHNWGCFMTAAEFLVDIPPSTPIIYNGFEVPEGFLNLGDPQAGISLTWWPPRSDFEEPYYLICTIKFFAAEGCLSLEQGSVADLPISILPHPVSEGILGVCWPDNALFDLVGHAGYICPLAIGVEEKSWGAIKSLFR